MKDERGEGEGRGERREEIGQRKEKRGERRGKDERGKRREKRGERKEREKGMRCSTTVIHQGATVFLVNRDLEICQEVHQ